MSKTKRVFIWPSATCSSTKSCLQKEGWWRHCRKQQNYPLVSTSNARQLGGQIALVLLPPGADLRTKVHTWEQRCTPENKGAHLRRKALDNKVHTWEQRCTPKNKGAHLRTKVHTWEQRCTPEHLTHFLLYYLPPGYNQHAQQFQYLSFHIFVNPNILEKPPQFLQAQRMLK